MEKSIPPFQRYARSKGIPALGSGAIYPVPESDIVIPAFELGRGTRARRKHGSGYARAIRARGEWISRRD